MNNTVVNHRDHDTEDDYWKNVLRIAAFRSNYGITTERNGIGIECDVALAEASHSTSDRESNRTLEKRTDIL